MANTSTSQDDYDVYRHSVSSEQPLLPYNQQGQTEDNKRRQKTRVFLSSKTKHYIILGMVALDVSGVLADIFITLITCDLGKKEEKWVGRSQEILYLVGLVFSSLFLAELMVTVWAFGISFFKDWFHCFDAVIIVASFVVDFVTHGIVEEIASLVIILRLWRLVKIIEELSVGAAEGMEEIEANVVKLELENTDLKTHIERMRTDAAMMRGSEEGQRSVLMSGRIPEIFGS